MQTSELPREDWDTWDPMLISEGLFSAANIFRYEHKLCFLNCIHSIQVGHARFNANIRNNVSNLIGSTNRRKGKICWVKYTQNKAISFVTFCKV